MNRSFILVVLVALLSSCSNDNSLVDKPIVGLNYKCSSGKVGKTDSYGRYTCDNGDKVTFTIGSTEVATISNNKNIVTSSSLFINKVKAKIFIKDLQLLNTDTNKDTIVIDNILEKQIDKDMLTHNATVIEKTEHKAPTKSKIENDTKDLTKKGNNIKIVTDEYPSYQYRAWGMGGDSYNSKAEVELDGKSYTIFALSKTNIKQLDTSTAGDVTTIIANIEKNTIIKQIQLTIAQNYLNKGIVLKVYDSSNILKGFSRDNYMGSSGTYIDFGIINIE